MRIITRGIGAVDHEIELHKMNLFAWRNGAGKSKIAAGFRFLVLGYDPALGKRPESMTALLNGRELSFAWEDNAGRKAERTLTLKESGSVKTNLRCSWVLNEEGKKAQPDVELLKLFGPDEQSVSELLWIKSLLDLSANQRTGRLQSLLTKSARTPQELAELVAEQTLRRLTDNEDVGELDDYMTLMDLLPDDAYRDTIYELAPMVLTKLEQTDIQGLVQWANLHAKEHAGKVREKRAADRELSARLAAVAKIGDKEIAEKQAERDRLNRESGALRERADSIEEQIKKHRLAQRDLDDARQALAEAEDRFPAKFSPGVLQEARTRAAELQQQLDTLPAPQFVSARECEEWIQLEAKLAPVTDEIAATVVPDVPELGLDRALEDLRRRLERAQQSPWHEVHTCADRIVELSVGKSPRITELRQIANRLHELAAVDDSEPVENIQAAIAGAERTHAERTAERDSKLIERARINRRLGELAAERGSIERRLVALEDAAAKETDAARQEHGRQRSALLKERDEVLAGISAYEAGARGVEEAARAHAAAVRRLDELGPCPSPIQDERVRIQDALDKTIAELAEAMRVRARWEELRNLSEELRREERNAKIGAALEWAAQRVREQTVTEAAGPLLEPMKAFLRAAGRTETPFMDAGRGAIGWRTQAGQEVRVEALSDGQYALFASALVTSMLSLRKTEVRLLLVEAGELDHENFNALLRGIDSAKDKLTSALVFRWEYDADKLALPTPAWNVVDEEASRVKA